MTASFEAGPGDEGVASGPRQFVTFDVAGERFAVPMAPVQEIIRVPEVARLPLAPPSLDGLANLRGRVLPIVSLRRMLGTDDGTHDDATRALVIRIGQPLGFVVDRVTSVIDVEDGQVEPAGSIRGVVRSEHLSGVIRRGNQDGELLMVLDFERLVRDQFAALVRTGEDVAAHAATAPDAPSGPAAPGTDGNVESDEMRMVSFTVAGQDYAIPIADVREIVQVPARVTTVPNVPEHVLGLMSLRRRLLPLVALRRLFGLSAKSLEEQDRIVVVGLPDGGQVGLVTDAVKEVMGVPRSSAEPMPALLARQSTMREFDAICRLGDGERLVSVVATDRLLGIDGLDDAMRAAKGTRDTTEHDMGHDDARRTEAADGDEAQVVVFRLGDEEFGVPIMSVQEIVRVPETLTRVPRTPGYVEGVINLRGSVLPVIDQRVRLGLPLAERNDRQRIMVYAFGGMRTGFVVDAVSEVLRIARADISPAPRLGEDADPLITQVAKLDGGRRMVLLIDPTHLVASDEVREMAALHDAPATDAPATALAQAA